MYQNTSNTLNKTATKKSLDTCDEDMLLNQHISWIFPIISLLVNKHVFEAGSASIFREKYDIYSTGPIKWS